MGLQIGFSHSTSRVHFTPAHTFKYFPDTFGVSPKSGSEGKESAYNAGHWGSSLDWEDPLQKEMAIHFSILAWRIPWTERGLKG